MERTTTPGRVLATLAGGAFALAASRSFSIKQLLDPGRLGLSTVADHSDGIRRHRGRPFDGDSRKNEALAIDGWLPALVCRWHVARCLFVCWPPGRGCRDSIAVEDINKRIVDKSADLDGARQRKAYADSQVQKMMTGSFCGRGCKDWKQNSRDIAVVIKQVEIEIAALGPQKPVNAQAEAMADIVLLFPLPATKAQVVAVLTLLVPFSKTLFFEIGSIVSLGFAFRPTPARIPAKSEAPRIPGNSNSGNSGPAKPPRRRTRPRSEDSGICLGQVSRKARPCAKRRGAEICISRNCYLYRVRIRCSFSKARVALFARSPHLVESKPLAVGRSSR